MASTPVYLVFLIDVGCNSATFGVDTVWVGKSTDGAERRAPSFASPEKIPEVLEIMDKYAVLIENWAQLYRWLGMTNGPQWAAFTEDSASQLIPHWITEYECQTSGLETFAYIDRNCGIDPQLIGEVKIEGNTTEVEAMRYSHMLGRNMVVTTQPLFL